MRSIDRGLIIKGTAAYLVAYAFINACGGLVFGVLGGISSGAGISGVTTTGISDSADAAAALTALGGFTGVITALFCLSVPVFAAAAWGLWQRMAWARWGTLIALGFTLVLSLLTLSTGFGSIFLIVLSLFGIYFYGTDEGIRRELSQQMKEP